MPLSARDRRCRVRCNPRCKMPSEGPPEPETSERNSEASFPDPRPALAAPSPLPSNRLPSAVATRSGLIVYELADPLAWHTGTRTREMKPWKGARRLKAINGRKRIAAETSLGMLCDNLKERLGVGTSSQAKAGGRCLIY